MTPRQQQSLYLSGSRCALTVLVLQIGLATGYSDPPSTYPRAGWEADIYRQPPLLNVKTVATIIDERTVKLTHFHLTGQPFDGIYGHLGTNNIDPAFQVGPRIGPELDRVYRDETVTLQLPEGQSLDGYTSISIYCEPVFLNLGSAKFAPPLPHRLDIIPVGGPDIAVAISGPPRRLYKVEATDDPGKPESWQTIHEELPTDTTFYVFDSMTNSARFYRASRE